MAWKWNDNDEDTLESCVLEYSNNGLNNKFNGVWINTARMIGCTSDEAKAKYFSLHPQEKEEQKVTKVEEASKEKAKRKRKSAPVIWTDARKCKLIELVKKRFEDKGRKYLELNDWDSLVESISFSTPGGLERKYYDLCKEDPSLPVVTKIRHLWSDEENEAFYDLCAGAENFPRLSQKQCVAYANAMGFETTEDSIVSRFNKLFKIKTGVSKKEWLNNRKKAELPLQQTLPFEERKKTDKKKNPEDPVWVANECRKMLSGHMSVIRPILEELKKINATLDKVVSEGIKTKTKK